MDAKKTIGKPMSGKSVTVAFTGTAGTTASMPATTGAVRIVSTADCFIDIGVNATAVVNTGLYLPAFIPEYFELTDGEKVSAIQVSAAGSIYVTPF